MSIGENGSERGVRMLSCDQQCMKTELGVSDQVRHKLAYTATEESQNLDILGISKGLIVLSE